MPHTTKSLWTILCGRWPALRPDVAEATARIDAPCLPRLLGGLGIALHSSNRHSAHCGAPRLVSNLGFGAFAAWEDIRGQRLGYLASDDESLMQPIEQFISAVRTNRSRCPAHVGNASLLPIKRRKQ